MKVVIDTNTLISGIFWGGLPYKILYLWISGEIDLLISKEILSEYIDVVHEISKSNEPLLHRDWSSFIIKNSKLIQAPSQSDVCRDPKDNMFLDCAVSGKADYIISGDKDLLDLRQIEGIKIINSKTFLKLFRII